MEHRREHAAHGRAPRIIHRQKDLDAMGFNGRAGVVSLRGKPICVDVEDVTFGRFALDLDQRNVGMLVEGGLDALMVGLKSA